jgi:TonB-dependent Receptor Plug Domain
MAARRVLVGKRKLAMVLVSTALVSVSAGAFEVLAQDVAGNPAANGPKAISIPAQALDAALRTFTRQTGWQVGYAAALVSGRTSGAVAGETDPLVALRAILSGSGIDIRVTGARTASLVAAGTVDEAAAAGTTVLGEITVSSTGGGVKLGTNSVADTGTTVLDATQVDIRTDGSGDANTFLRGLPNVQYQDDTSEDAGVDGQTILNTKPLELSISGGRTYENNFILDGIGINTVTGTEEVIGNGELTDSTSTFNADRVYGLHSQTFYVPGSFVEQATVMDSNVSAQYGAFQGGVVSYKLAEPAKDRFRAEATVDYQNDRMVNYELGTEDGTNPNGVEAPEFIKRKTSIAMTGPITDNVAVIGQFSRTDAWTEKDLNYIYGDDRVESESTNDFYRVQLNAETDLGDFKLEGLHTDYHQDFQASNWRDLEIDMETQSYAGKLEHDYAFDDFTLGGLPLSNVKVNTKVSVSKSENVNLGGENVANNYALTEYSGGAIVWTSKILDWCRIDNTRITAITCSEGGHGEERGQGQTQYTVSQQLSGEVLAGSFLTGYNATFTQAHRWRAEDFINYASYTTRWDKRSETGYVNFTCQTVEACTSEQYANNKAVYSAFDIEAQVMALNSYLEFDQTFGWLNLRPGIRFEYDDYQHNLNIAPRLVATVTPTEDFSISGGYNRYFDGQNLAYAVRDKQPRAKNYSRSNTTAGVVTDSWGTATETYYSNKASDLDTPYADEFSAGINWTDPWTDGEWRLRYVYRESKSQYASETVASNSRVLTNNASGSYKSASIEYAKELPVSDFAHTDGAMLSASLTWADRNVSADSYFYDEDELEDHIYYNGQSYTKGGFNVVTGNLDIPLKAELALSGSFLEERLKLGVATKFNFAYDGVAYTDEDVTIGGTRHEIWQDKAFDAMLTVDVSGSYKVASVDDHGVTLNFKVINLFNEIGNATSSKTTPWVIGRTFWVGASAEF